MLAQMFAMALRGRRSGPTLDIGTTDVLDTVTDPDDASAILTFKNDGTLTITTSIGTTSSTWMTGSTNGAAYDLVVTTQAGSFTSGTGGNLGSNRALSVVRTSIGSKACQALYEITPAGGGTALTSKVITLTAEVSA